VSSEDSSDAHTLQGHWIVCQLGARENYMVGRALASSGRLAALITDAWEAPGSLPARFSGRLRDRYHRQLADQRIEAPRYLHLARELGGRYLGSSGWRRILARNTWFDEMAARRLSALVRRGVPCDTVFAYSYAAGAIFRTAKSLGLRTVLGQIDPGPVEDEIVADLYGRAGQSQRYERIPAAYWSRWRDEIALSDIVVANSQWSKRALMRADVPKEKISVVPLAYDAPASVQALIGARPRSRGFTPEHPLRLLFLGQVTLRKGIGPLFEAILRMPAAPIRLDIVGEVQVDLPPAIEADARVTLHGAAQRSTVHRYYADADLFVFPTFSDGFGITQLEAMAHGLPVLTSRNCGDVIEHGVNGFVLEDVTPETIKAALEEVLAAPSLVDGWSAHARVPKAFSQEALAERLLRLRICR
jgi:glycosyltransferase involved in cell wall biosynthesis